MNLRFIVLALALTGCKDIIQQLAKQGDAGPTASSAEPAPTSTTDDDDPRLAPTGTTTGAKPSATAKAKTAATARPASPAELEKTFAALDINDDRQLDGIEVKRCGCANADSNGDGEITKAEYLAAGLLGKLGPGVPATASPTPNAPVDPPTQPTPPAQPTPPPPAPVAGGGLPPGRYNCFGTVGSFYGARGTLRIVDGQRYDHGDGSGGGNYVFDPATKKIKFTSGLFANPNSVSSAKQISPTYIEMQTGRDGFYTWDCKR